MADDVPAITVPQPPPGVYRDPDIKWDLPGVREISHGWLSADGQTLHAIVDRGEPLNVLFFRGEKIVRDPAFLELDLTTRTITRQIDLPADGPWVGVGSSRSIRYVEYLPATDRLVGWKTLWKKRKGENGIIAVGPPTARQLHSLDLNDPQHPVTRDFEAGAPGRTDRTWRWAASDDGRWLWYLIYEHDEYIIRLQKIETNTLQASHQIEPQWSLPIEAMERSDPLQRLTWRIDEGTNELWFGALIKDGKKFGLHWLRFDLTDGSLKSRTLIHSDVYTRPGPGFSHGGSHLHTPMPGTQDNPYAGPMRYWLLPQAVPDFQVDTHKAGSLSAGPLLADNRYLFSSGSMDPNGERVAWRYDRERQAWSWPRKIVVPQGTTHRRYSADGSTLVTFNLVDGRKNRIAVYRFGDDERYDTELAKELSRQRPRSSPPPLSEAEHTIKVSPEGEEVAVQWRAVPTPDGGILRTHASADGKRVALWMMHQDRRPPDHRGMHLLVDPKHRVFEAVVIDAESGETIQTVSHPPGYKYEDLWRHTQLALSGDGRWLILVFAKSRERMMSLEYPPPGQALVRVVDLQTGRTVAERQGPKDAALRIYMIDHGQRLLLRSFGRVVPTVSGFEFCTIPTLETEAEMKWTWPEHDVDPGSQEQAIAHEVRYDRDRSRFIALMRQSGGLYNGRQIPINYWIQYFDAKTMRPIGRGPVFRPEHGAQYTNLRDDSAIVTYEHPDLGYLIQVYPHDPERPSLRIDGSAYPHGMSHARRFQEPWIAIRPSMQRNGKPGIVLVNTKTHEVLGPLPISGVSEVLWMAPDARRFLVHPDRNYLPYGQRDTASTLRWMMVRE